MNQAYMNQAKSTFQQIIDELRLDLAPAGFFFGNCRMGGRQHGEKIVLNDSTPPDGFEIVFRHELSHYIVGRNWIFNTRHQHDTYFLATQIAVWGGLENYNASGAADEDAAQMEFKSHSFEDTLHDANFVYYHCQNDNINKFIENLKKWAHNEEKQSLKYKFEVIAMSVVLVAILAAFAYIKS
jgi:hypothetical protein